MASAYTYTFTPVVSAAAYAANQSIGGLLSFGAIPGSTLGKNARIGSVVVVDTSNAKIPFEFLLFNRALVTTVTDNAYLSWTKADFVNLKQRCSVVAADYALLGSTSTVSIASDTYTDKWFSVGPKDVWNGVLVATGAGSGNLSLLCLQVAVTIVSI